MKKSIKKKGLSWIIFCLFLLLVFIVIVNNRINIRDSRYNYTGPLGTYEFIVTSPGDHFLNWSVTYKLTDFVQTIKEYNTPFPYGPSELEDIPMEGFRDVFQNTKNVYITRDVYLDSKTKSLIVVSLLSLDRVIEKFKTQSLLASIEDNDFTHELDLPVITCEDSNIDTLVIWLKEGDKNEIYKESDYCIIGEFKEGDDPNLVSTKIAYHIIGVM